VEENKDDTNKVKAEPTIDVRKETNFAELIPEEEKEIKQDNSFLNRVKNVLINVKEKVKNKESVIGDEEGPGIKKEIKKEEAKKDEIKKEEVKKKEIKEKEKIKEIKTEKKSFFESLKEKFMGEKKEKNFFSKMLDKVKSVINKKESQVMEENYDIVIPERIKKKYEPKKSKKELLYESEVEQALKDKEIDVIFDDKENEFIEQEKKEKEYMEDEDYTFFLNERELKQLSEKEKIIIPMVLPKKKEFVDYSVNRFPEEILSNKRTNLNKHIPILTKQSDIEKMIIGLIDNNDIQNFRAMVDKTSNLNQVLTTQYALLTYATKNRKYDIMKFLIFSGADINKKDNKSETPLTTAIKNNDFKAVQILIDAGANLNEPDVLKRTPLIYAIEKNYEDIAIYLIEKGADINITNAEGEGTLSIATRLNRQYIKKIILEKIKGKTIQ
jgi:hypothetical protein